MSKNISLYKYVFILSREKLYNLYTKLFSVNDRKIRFKEIFKKKGIEFGKNYKLLEVCNPNAAKNVLDTDPDLGLLLPCTIAVYQKNGQNIISLARPTALLSIVSNDKLQKLSKDIEVDLISVIDKSK